MTYEPNEFTPPPQLEGVVAFLVMFVVGFLMVWWLWPSATLEWMP